MSNKSNKVVVFKPYGRLDAECYQQVRTQIMQMISHNPEILVIDLENINFIDSRGLGLLITILKFMRGINGRLILCTPNNEVKMLLKLTNTITLFEIYNQMPQNFN